MANLTHKWLILWLQAYIFINIRWHVDCGPLLSPFEVLEVPKTHNLPGLSKSPAPLHTLCVYVQMSNANKLMSQLEFVKGRTSFGLRRQSRISCWRQPAWIISPPWPTFMSCWHWWISNNIGSFPIGGFPMNYETIGLIFSERFQSCVSAVCNGNSRQCLSHPPSTGENE